VKVVLDTNVLLSGLMLPESVPGRIVRAWRAAQFDLVLSEPMLDEIGRVLAYPKIERRLKWDQETISRFLLLLQFKADVVDISSTNVEVPRDPQDVSVLATLVAGGANYLVTGDKDLLTLGHDYPIVTPAEFASRL
jgi:putative PIN family toxin of toxin-antitoxin system